MPNHFHGIIEILDTWKNYEDKELIAKNGQSILVSDIENSEQGQPQEGQPQGIAPTESEKNIPEIIDKKKLGDVVGAFESITTVAYIRGVKDFDWKRFEGKLWQRNYWEHIIRNGQSFSNISNFFIKNPGTWKNDKFYQI